MVLKLHSGLKPQFKTEKIKNIEYLSIRLNAVFVISIDFGSTALI